MSQLTDYLDGIRRKFAAGNATEHTYRSDLEALFERLAPNVSATNEPKRVQCGAPDYVITRGAMPVGYVEAKDIGEPLDKVEKGEQMARYYGLGNLLLTDYVEFRWYVDGKRRMTARLSRLVNKRLVEETDGPEKVEQLLHEFLHADVLTVKNPKELAQRMAKLADIIRPEVLVALKAEAGDGPLHDQIASFRKVLLHELTEAQFADMYTQTLCYGLFAARCNTPDNQPFSRYLAPHQLPRANPFLRELFGHFAGPELDDKPYVWVVDDLAELLHHADIAAILADFGRRTRQEDPVVHFYETFLAAYDPKMREARGVYYTPEPVVSYIVRSVDHLLKTAFMRPDGHAEFPDGLADTAEIIVREKGGTEKKVHKVQILDPAAGTGTFLYDVVKHIHNAILASGGGGGWSGYVDAHLLPRLFGFELLMAPYAVAHLKLGLQLKEYGYDLKTDRRLNVYLTNTLEEAFDTRNITLFAQRVAAEANATGQVKQNTPVMVILGNPPYSVTSQNRGEWISKLLQDYKKGLKEKKLNLDDDFIKFFRFAQWRIEQTGYGILAFIANHTYLDGVTHRRMRESLMETFDDIYILDLHGNTLRAERAPDGVEDKNVFDIKQGVAIGIFVKKAGNKQGCVVRHAELWGARDLKYKQLLENDVSTMQWNELKDIGRQSCLGAFRFFTPKAFDNIEEYCAGWSVKEIFPLSGPGVKTERDRVSIHWDKSSVQQTVENFRALDEAALRALYKLEKDSRDWTVANAKADVLANRGEDSFRPILYRPFDMRQTWYSGRTRGFIGTPGYPAMRHMLKNSNLALLTCRQQAESGFYHAFCCNTAAECCAVSLKTREITSLFPLYLYPNGEMPASLFDHDNGRRPNLAAKFIEAFASRLGMTFAPDGKGDGQKTFGPEDVFAYLYAVFHCPTYRRRYAEFLKIDFPRLPLTRNPALFRELGALGEKLVGLHLTEQYGPNIVRYEEPGSNLVATIRYAPPTAGSMEGRLWINTTQYFAGITPEVWKFHIGGYQVCQKWLKDRKGRVLSYDDILHYRRIVAALSETIRLMDAIDAAIDAHGGWPLA